MGKQTVGEQMFLLDVPTPPEAEVDDRAASTSAGAASSRDSRARTARAGSSRGRASRARAAATARQRRDEGMPVSPISVSVPASIAAGWKVAARRAGLTQVDLLLDAVIERRDRLSDLVRERRAAARTPAPVLPSDGLFVRTGSAAKRRAGLAVGAPTASDADADGAPTRSVRAPGGTADEPFVTMSLRMLSANLDVLDALVAESGAESRSQFVTAVMASKVAEDAEVAESRAAQVSAAG